MNYIKLIKWGGIAIAAIVGEETLRRLLRKKGQKKLQEKVDSSYKPVKISNPQKDEYLPIEVLENNSGIPQKFNEVNISKEESKKWLSILSTANGVITPSLLTAGAFNGLLKCNVPLSDLFKLKNNPTMMRGFVLKNGRFAEQAVFTEVSMASAAPLIAFQILTIITSQYHQQITNERLKSIENKIDGLFNYIKAEDRGRLMARFKKLCELNEKTTFDMADKVAIDGCIDDAFIIRDKFKSLLNNVNLNIDYKGTDSAEAQSKVDKLRDSNYFEYLEFAILGEILYYIANVVACKISKSLDNEEDVKIHINNINPTFINNYRKQFEKIKHDVLEYIKGEYESSMIMSDKIKDLYNETKKIFDEREKLLVETSKRFNCNCTQYILFSENGEVKKYIGIEAA